jgi:hypothetical protein
MKFFLCLLVGSLVFAAGGATAATINESAMADSTNEVQSPIPFEFDTEFAYIGDSTVERGSRSVRDFDETYWLARLIYTPRVSFGILRLGAAGERYGFDLPAGVQLERTLRSVTGIVGLDTQFSDSILFRFEAQPGFYGTNDNLDGDTFHVPFILGGTYLYSSSLQFVFGVSVDYEREIPVYPGGGVRWRLGPQWLLNAVLPTPRLEYEASQSVTVYVGANFKDSTFRVDESFGTRQAGDPRLNSAMLTYTEVRAGAGVEIKLLPEVKLSFEAGYVPYREFDYQRANVRYHHEEGAPYGSIALHAAF